MLSYKNYATLVLYQIPLNTFILLELCSGIIQVSFQNYQIAKFHMLN